MSATAAAYPDHSACRDDQMDFTYRELDRLSTDLALALVEAGAEPGDRIGLLLERSAIVPVALLAVLKARGVYVCADPRDPDQRRKEMFSRAGVALVMVSSSFVHRVDGDAKLLVLDAGDLPAASGAVDDLTPPSPSDAAGLVFTSGSTGQPKAIVLGHSGLTWFALNDALPDLGTDDCMGQISSLSFDAFHYEIWRALATGATLVTLPHIPQMLATGIERQLTSRRITALLVPTMAFNHIIEADPRAFSGVRVLGVGGDVLAVSAVRKLYDGGFAGALYNLYGPAEITTACTIHAVRPADADEPSIPLGRTLDGCSIELVDEAGRPVPPGTPGEAVIAGPGVSLGYQDSPVENAAVFGTAVIGDAEVATYRSGDILVQHDDWLEFVGRRDRMVKVSGHRVDPIEIERVLLDHESVDDAVLIVERQSVEPSLVAIVVLRSGASVAELREFAESRLPAHLVPHSLVTVDRLPSTDHGKRDVSEMRMLALAESARLSAFTPPVTETQKRVGAMWSTLLRVSPVGLDDDFFRLGGNSILLFRLNKMIKAELSVDLGFKDLLQEKTLTALSELIDERATR
ncbi:non-ribosomal peptide synthetase [Micromonospora sp. NPDC049801]|uniref:non-ribosomal peptide synthetase n=1 Tax=unclassified Micromonospora TaxID=2617518 RepID=UPI0033F696F6